MEGSDSDVEENLGILQPTFLEQIKKILSEYRNDIQIIKEVIQNADDAGATEVKILYQGKSINCEQQEEKKFRKFLRAPALVFYNDSVFTMDDWKNIRSIYTSNKAQDPLKIGRFGLGFKSIFHMTDFPTIISGDRVMFINPSEQDQNKICTSIRLKNLKRSRNLRLSEFLDVFEGTFGFHEEMLDPGHFPATIFFFPLRLRESPLSDTIYSESEVSALLKSFVVESDKNILFAKTVSKIQVFVDNVDRDVLDSTQLVHCSFGKDEAAYSVEINNESKTLIPERKDINKILTAIGKTVPDTSEHWTFDVSVVSNRRLQNGETKKSRSRWLIVNYLKGGQLSERTQTLLKDEDLSYHHIVGIATRLKETDGEQMSADTGRVFCYQPLPLENHTGLPILVNASFALGNNRRQIKWEDEDDSKMLTDKERDWNHALLSEILPFGYHVLFTEVIELSKRNNNMKCFVQSVYNILPDVQNTDEKWKVLGNTFLENAKNDDMFFTKKEGGHWLNAKEAILLSEEREEFVDTINQLLILDEANVVLLSQKVMSSLNDTTIKFCKMSPHFLGHHMLHHMSYKEMSRQQKEHLLQYLETESSFDQLVENLELLPRADDSYTCFGGTKKIFLESGDVIELFPGMFSYFVYSNLLPETSDIMKHIVETDKQRVKALDAENAALMLENILTVNFRRGTFVTLNDVETPKWKHWIERIWQFIQLRFTDSISVFESLPIFPFSFKPDWETADEINLCSLSSMLMFFPQCTEKEEAESISQAFELMSVNIVRNVPNFINSGFVSKYITDERAVSLLQLLARIGTKEIEHFNYKVDGNQQEAFLGYLSHTLHMDLTPGCLHVLKNLRMFKQYNSTEDKDFRLVSAHENKTVFQGNRFPVEFYKPMIMISSNADPSLAVKLGAEIVDDKQHVIGILNKFGTKLHTPAEIQKLMNWVLRNAEMLENQEITMLAQETSFIESECGLWKRPSELFDPNDKLLSRLFQNEGLFPKTTEDNDVQIIQGLLHLGMRNREKVRAVDIERTCEIINKNAKESSTVTEEKAVALLEFLNHYPTLVNRNFLWDKKVICIRNTAQDYVIGCKNSQSTNNMCQPSNIKSSQYKYLIESVCFTIDCTALQNVAEELGWLQPPEVKDVIKHFEKVVRRFNSTMKSSSISMITKIYEWFAERQRQGDAVNTQLLQTFSEQNNKFIWNGDFFVSPEEIYTETSEEDLDLHQFAYKLPMELKHLSDFFLSLGCASHQHLQMYLNTLSRINNEVTSKPCNSSLRQVAISVLNKLTEKHLDAVKGLNLCFPIQQNDSIQLMMKPANECAFSEASCLESFTADNYQIVHNDVPISTAKALGVPSLTQQMLSASDFFEEWGQKENLTIRIRNLIKHGYEDGFTVIKELFQNADDAGASTFCMMYDERENKDARNNLISDRMSECQGPAFWVYNDAMFSEEDFINIRKLGIGTKQEYAGKTGKFGQGFCAVYNITDVPSLVSGSSMIIFDPHTSFLEKVLPKGRPGIRIDFSQTRQRDLLHTFSNQFKPYENMFRCRINSEESFYFPGTLFRLPLRARASDISDTIYTKTAVKEFLQSIMDNSSNMVLFTQNTKTIKLYHLRENISNPTDAELLFEVDAEKHDVPKGHDQQNYTHVVKDVCERKKNEILERHPLKQLQEINICTRVYENMCNEQKDETWLVAWATGTDSTFLRTSYGHKELLPLGSVAVPVVKCTELIAENPEIKYKLKRWNELQNWFYKCGHYYCFLPTPQEHPFAFHINGKFNLSVDRKTLKPKTDEHTNETHWNEMLIRFAVVSAFQFLLESKEIVQPEPFQLWPISDHNESSLSKCFVETFYCNLTEGIHNFPIFKSGDITIQFSQCIFLDPDVREENVIGDVASKILEIESEQTFVDLPRQIFELLKKSDENGMKRRTITCTTFLLHFFLPKLDRMPSEVSQIDRDCTLRFAIDKEIPDTNNWLKKNKCIPADSGTLKEPDKIVDPSSVLARMFLDSEGFLPDNGFVGNDIRRKLIVLGMRSKVLPDGMVLERAKSIADNVTGCGTCVLDQSLYLLSYIGENLNEHVGIFDQLKELPFVPVMCKPTEWPLRWQADVTFEASKQLQKRITCDFHGESDEPVILEKSKHLYTCDSIDKVSCIELIVNSKFCDKLEEKERLPRVTLEKLFEHLGIRSVAYDGQFVDKVVRQLMIISQVYNDGLRTDAMVKVTHRMIKRIYEFLERNSNAIPFSQAEILKDQPVVWVNSSFVSPDKVSHDKALYGCEPYLYSLCNSEIARCPTFCLSLQISDNFCARDIAEVLEKIATDNCKTPCTEKQLTACLNLLKHLLNCFEREKIKSIQTFLSDEQTVAAVYVPDENGILTDSSKLCLNDSDDIEKTASMIFIHERVPQTLAQALNIKSKVLHQLEEKSEDIEDFYQEELLCYRLRRLVDGLSYDTGLFKELIQNADDAGASEIVFIKDFTNYPTQHILDETFAPLQGPALCVYNNSTFTREDLVGIRSLGMGSKSDDPSKIGKYGVGFNVVYNITDAPSIYTTGEEIENDETLCIFDPLAKYIPNVSKSKPGKRYKELKSLRESHADVLKGYHELKFFQQKRNGTLFRFPLRNESSAIKKNVISFSELSDLLEKLCVELKYSMLFLKNLKTVKVFSFKNDEYVEDYFIEMKLSDEDSLKRYQFAETNATMCETYRSNKKAVFDIDQKSFAYMMTLRETLSDRCTSSSYNVIQTVGFHETLEIPTIVKDNYMNGNIALLPQAGVAIGVAKEKKGNHGNAFCVLPLPVDTGLPVHVHGHFILDHETRRSLWLSKYMERCFKTHWNLTILKHVVAKAYTIHLKMWKSVLFRDLLETKISFSDLEYILDIFFSHFPVYEQASCIYWKELTARVYRQLLTEHFQFLPCCSKQSTDASQLDGLPHCTLSWISLISESDDFPVFYCENTSLEKATTLDAVLRSLGMKISCVPKEIRESLEHIGQTVEMLEPCHVIDYLSTFDKDSVVRPAICVDLHVNQTVFLSESNLQHVFQYCLKHTEHFFEKLTDLPICMTQDGVLRKVNASNPLFVTKYTEFFPERLGHFLHKCLSEGLSAQIQEHEEDKNTKGFANMSNQLFRRFTVHEFNDFALTDGLFETRVKIGMQSDQLKALIKRFWDFFVEQLPNYGNEEGLSVVNESLDIIDSLKLIPAKEPASGETFFVAPADIDCLIDLDTLHEGTKLYNVVKRFGITELDLSVFNDDQLCETPLNDLQTFKRPYKEPYEILKEQIPNFKKPEKIIHCFLKNITKVSNTDINTEEAGMILKYFADHVNLIQDKQELANLKELPVFVLQTEKITQVRCFPTAVVVPKDLPKTGLDSIIEASNVVLLRCLDVKDLYEYLHINYLSVEKVYTEVIFPYQNKLRRDQFYTHVDFICKAVISEQAKLSDYFMQTLEELRFIDVGTDKFARVKDLFKEHERKKKFFKYFCKKTEMLPRCLHAEHFIIVFKRLGLQCKMTVDLFERFANEIAEGSISVTDDEQEKSKLLVDRLFKMGPKFFKENHFQSLATIKFMHPGKVREDLKSLHEQFNSASLICFENSIPYEEKLICWTTSNILPVWANPVKETAFGLVQKLGIRWHPDIDQVIEHCKYIGKVMSEKLTALEGDTDHVTEVMEEIYKALDDEATCTFENLKDVPIIYFPTTNTIHAASNVVIECEAGEEIVPYILKSPTHFGQFERLFVRMGAVKRPSIDKYIDVLIQIKDVTQENVVSPSQRYITFRAMVNIFIQLRKMQPGIQFKPDILYLLNDDNVLTDARLLVIANNKYLCNRLKRGLKLNFLTTFDDFTENSLRMDEIIDCLKNMHECYRPSLLTDIVQERVNMANVVWLDSDEAADVEKFIHHKLFIASFCRLARHGIKNKQQRQWNEEMEREMTECIYKIRLKHVEGIQTSLVVHENVIESTCEPKKVLVSVENNCTSVYFETAGNSSCWYTDVSNAIILHLKDWHCCLMDELLFTAQKLLVCKDPEKCEEILDRDEIEAYKNKCALNKVSVDPEEESDSEPYHNCAEAKRWQKQAQCDLDSAAASLMETTGVSYNWVCYIAHQASEKSLKAAWFAKDGRRMTLVGDSHCIKSIADGLSTELVTLARDLDSVTNWHTHMRYPNTVSPPSIPADCYSRDDAKEVTKIARGILDEVQKIILCQDSI